MILHGTLFPAIFCTFFLSHVAWLACTGILSPFLFRYPFDNFSVNIFPQKKRQLYYGMLSRVETRTEYDIGFFMEVSTGVLDDKEFRVKN